MKTFIDIEGSNGLVRDTSTMAVINTNEVARNAAKQARLTRLEQQEKINTLENKMENIENMLQKILNKLGND